MNHIRRFLEAIPLLQAAEPEVLDEVADVVSWFALPGGWQLIKKGEKATALYLVLSGALVVVDEDEKGETLRGFIRAGEPVGEMALLQGERRSASIYALRDTELLRLDRVNFFRLTRTHAALGLGLSRLVLMRLRERRRGERVAPPRVFTLIASSRSIPVETYAQELLAAIRKNGKRAVLITEEGTLLSNSDFDNTERQHDIVLLASHLRDTAFYRFAIRHSDRFLVFARQDARPSKPFPLAPDENSPARRFRLVDLVWLNEGAQRGATPLEWLQTTGATRLFRWNQQRDPQRLARVISARSIGVVFSGGGARAYAQIGAIRALREAGIPIDFIGGTSMGAIIAAGVALGWTDQELEDNVRDAFVDSNPLGDHTIPVVALTKGLRMDERLERYFGGQLIEELSIPFFCVASGLVSGKPIIYRTGSLRKALRATVALPGIVPPVVDDGDVIVDGALMNNYPVDIMRSLHRGPVIGMDVARQGTLRVEDFIDPPNFAEWMMKYGFSTAPPIASLLIRSATVSSDLMQSNDVADLTICPDLGDVEIRDWKNFDDVIELGYQATQKALAEHPDIFTIKPRRKS